MYTDITFLDMIKPYVIADMKSSGILASMTAAQAFIESNKGNSGLTAKCNNLFGIKGTYNGQSGTFLTTEYYNGKATKIYAPFRKYPSWRESIADHSAMFNRMARYRNLRGCKDYKLACKYVKADGYATSPTYTNTLIAVIERYKLYEWDSATTVVPAYSAGKTYTLQYNMYVRDSAGGNKLKYLDLTANAKAHAVDSAGVAVLKKGARVTCKGIATKDNAIWLQIPSGWICGRSNGKIFIQ